MLKDDCVFCKIVKGEIPSVKIWQDEEHMAILDINPNVEGMTLVLTKEHYDSYAFDIPEKTYRDFMSAARKVAGLLEKGLGVKRVALVMEGMGINHAHLKLYPLYGIDQEFKEMWAKNKVYFDKYEGYISTQLGPQKTGAELEAVAKKILDNQRKD